MRDKGRSTEACWEGTECQSLLRGKPCREGMEHWSSLGGNRAAKDCWEDREKKGDSTIVEIHRKVFKKM